MSSQFSADQIYLLKVITSYRNYRQDSLALIDEKLRQWERSGAGKRQPSLDRVYTQKLDRIRECIEQNATFISHIVPNAMQPQSHDPFNVSGTPDPAIVSHHSGQDNMEKVRSTLRQVHTHVH